MTAGVGAEKELTEPPQPKHIENNVERILTKICVAEHVSEERPGMHKEVVEVGGQGKPMGPTVAAPHEEHANEFPKLREQKDHYGDVDEFAVDGKSLVFDHKSESHTFVMFP